MNALDKFELTTEQINSLKKLKAAFKYCQKKGLVFLAKQDEITAYQAKAYKHAVPLHEHWKYGEIIPYEGVSGCIKDSGADDMEHFPKGFIDEIKGE